MQRQDDSGPAAATRRKAASDRGLNADKVPGFDPAAAPLGTDAEAAGAPPLAATDPAADPPLPKSARADPAGLAADPSGNERGSYRMQDRLVWPVIAAVLVAIAVVVAIVFVV